MEILVVFIALAMLALLVFGLFGRARGGPGRSTGAGGQERVPPDPGMSRPAGPGAEAQNPEQTGSDLSTDTDDVASPSEAAGKTDPREDGR